MLNARRALLALSVARVLVTVSVVLATATAPVPAHLDPAAELPGPPENPAARCAAEFIGMVNDSTPANVRAFETAWASAKRLGNASIEDRVPRFASLHEKWGKVTVTGMTETKDKLVVVAATTGSGWWLDLAFNMSAEEPGKLDSIEIQESTQPIERRALTVETRAQTVQGVADALRGKYVYPEKGAQMADAILKKLKGGEYDGIENEAGLARQLTNDCRAITHDMHLGIRVSPKREADPAEPVMMPPQDMMRRENYGFRKVEVLDGNVGYLRFDGFMQGEEAERVATSAMSFLSGCDAIIFDVRFNGGGSPEMVRYVTSYLFESKTHLNDMVDREGKVVEEYWTLESVPGPRPRADVPVFVLTSGRTFSGAEEFCYNLKNLKRATLVGETTGGGAHPVDDDRVNDRFVVRVPFMRAQNPISKTNWEGTGVEPDVKTTASEALDKAAALAREAAKSGK